MKLYGNSPEFCYNLLTSFKEHLKMIKEKIIEVINSISFYVTISCFYLGHPSSESSESEQDIHSEDDCHDINPRDVDKNLLREVMHFRMKRHEIEKRMKECKRDLISHNTKVITLQKKIQKTKDALEDAWRTLSTIPVKKKFLFVFILSFFKICVW